MTAFVTQMISSDSITEAGQWYTFDYIIDMDTHDVSVTLYKKGNSTPLGTLSYEALARTADGCSGWQETKNEFVRLVHYGEATGYMDNISIKYVEEDPNLIFSENYESSIVAAPSNGVGTVMTESNGNKYMKMDMTVEGKGWDKTMFAYDFPEVTSGVIDISFDYMKEEKVPQTYMVLSGTNTWNTKEMLRLMGVFYNSGVFTGFDGTEMLNNSGKKAVLEAGKWYTQKVTLNLDTKEATATLYEREGSEAIGYMHRTKLSDSTGYNGWPANSEGFVRIAHFGDTDACIDNIKITKGEAPKDYAYSMAVVGDTQTLTSKYPDTLAGLYDWIANNAEAKKMKWVFGLGDITDTDTDEEWTLAKAQFAKLDGVVPYSVIRGNHDSAEKFVNAFPYSEFSGKIDGSMSEDMLNTYQKFTVGDTKYMVVNLDWGAPDEAVAWANEVIAKNPQYNVIVSTHAYLNSDGTTLDSEDEGAPTDYSSLNNNGDELWNELIKKHKNIVLVLSGHISTENIIVTKTQGDNGNTVTQMLIDPQTTDQNNVGTGLGLVTMLYFSEDGKNVDVEYYSTLRGGKYLSGNQFSMDLDTVVYEETDESVIFAEDYDGEYVTEKETGTEEIITDETTGNKYIKVGAGWTAKMFGYEIPQISSGEILVQFDYMKDAENLYKQAYLILGDSNVYNNKDMLRILSSNSWDKKNAYVSAFETNNFMKMEADKWYTARVKVDLDTHKVSAEVYDKETEELIGSVSEYMLMPSENGYTGWPATSNSFVRLRHFGDADVYMDNISIRYTNEDPTLIFGEDYDGASVTVNNSGTCTLITDEDTGNKYMKMNAGYSDNQFGYKIPEISSGKIKVSFDYMKDEENAAKQSYVVLANNNFYQANEWLRLLGVNNYGHGTVFTAFNGDSRLGTSTLMEAGKWYTEEVVIDMESHEVTATLYEQGNDTALGSVHFDELAAGTAESAYNAWPYSSTSFVALRHFGDADAYIDNIAISYVCDAPSLDSESVKIKSVDGEEELVWTDVKSASKVIDIDFNTDMSYGTMLGEYVYVTKKDSEEKVAATLTYADGVATLTASENWEPGTYTIHVSGEVKNIADQTLGDDFAVDFTVVPGSVSATIDSVFKGETQVNNYADVKAGDVLTVKVSFTNTTGKEKAAKLVVGYYNEKGALVGIGDGDVNITADEESASDITYTVQSFAGATNMKFFLLDGYSQISPIAVSYPLN